MTCPPGCECPESLLSNGCNGRGAAASPEKSRYFVGITPAVIFVACLSVLAFFAVVIGATAVAASQNLFFFVLPLATATGGAFLVAAPQSTPLGEADDPTAVLLLRLAGAVAIAYAGSAMLVGRSSCCKVRAAHLALLATSLGAMSAAFTADASSPLAGPGGVGERAAASLAWLAAAAAAGAIVTAVGPAVSRKIQRGKPAGPAVLTCWG